jgi:hypothetical protein
MILRRITEHTKPRTGSRWLGFARIMLYDCGLVMADNQQKFSGETDDYEA